MPGVPDPQTAWAFKGEAVLWTFIIGSMVFSVTFTVYSVIHRFKVWPRIFSPRTYLYPSKTPIERPNRFMFSWVWEIYSTTEDDILRTVGLDALVFLRMQRLYAFLFLACSVFGLGVLLPLNLTYGNPAVNDADYYSFARTTMANLPRRGDIKNVHVYSICTLRLWFNHPLLLSVRAGRISPQFGSSRQRRCLLVLEYRHYIHLRFKWLTLPRTHNYSLMVTSIPPSMRSVPVLKGFFDRLLSPHGPDFGGESVGRVISVTLTMNLKRVEALVRERALVHESIEHLLALLALPEDKLWPRTWMCGWSYSRWRADTLRKVRTYAERLQVLNEVVEHVQQEVRRVFYGHDDAANFGLAEIETVVPPLDDEELEMHEDHSGEEGESDEMRAMAAGFRGPRKALGLEPPELPPAVDAPPRASPERFSYSCSPAPHTSLTAPLQAHEGIRDGGSASPPKLKMAVSDDGDEDDDDEVANLREASVLCTVGEGGAAPGDGISLADLRHVAAQDGFSMSMVANASSRKLTDLAGPAQPSEAASAGSISEAGPAPADRAGGSTATTQDMMGRVSKGQLNGRPLSQEPGGEYGSFSPTTVMRYEKANQAMRPQTRELLDRFFSKPISSEVYSTAFVTVSTLEATAVLRQTVTYQRPFEVFVEEAPVPEDILWGNADTSFVSSYVRTAVGHVVTAFLTLTFAVPTAFISALNSVETLKHYIPRIEKWLHSGSEVRRVNKRLALISPLLLLILLSIIPPIFGLVTRAILRDSRTVSESHYKVYKRYFGFLFYNALVVMVISNGVYETIMRTYNSPADVLFQIGATLPKPAAFFLNFIVIKALTGLPSELIRINSFLTHAIKCIFYDELTDQHRRRNVLGCQSLRHPGGFNYGKFLAEHTLIYVYVMCYSCLAPVILPAGVAFFAGSYLVYKRQLLFVYEPEYETGGQMFKLILRYTFTGLFVGQFVMFCMLVTKFAYEDISCFLPLPVLTFFAMDVVTKWYGRIETHVPLNLAVNKDLRFWQGLGKAPTTDSGEVLDLVKENYHHPSVRSPWIELSRPIPSPSVDESHCRGGYKGGGPTGYCRNYIPVPDSG